MKKFITVVVVIACLALCAIAWPQCEKVEEISKPTQTTAVNTPEVPAVAPKEETEVLPPTEKENTELQQPEPPMETIPEPEATPPETPVVPEVQPTPEPKTTPEPAPDPVPAQTVVAPQPSDMVYVPGFGWLESQGEGTVIYAEDVYENGNKAGIMG